ncbi:uncharacterized protein LOC114317348 [Camellia sinensis]|uniref:uncharacterized protein LOC114317348 n=1 Tax=Camellia sinensis TaxID=4442 RepID=UPI00103698EE|nr:uncharacterized protein LOC114317348 [Camellia sinensis]
MEFLDDYDFEIHYHLGKASVVADALSRKFVSMMARLAIRKWKMMGDANEFDLQLGESSKNATLFTVIAQPTLVTRAVEAQLGDPEVDLIEEKISKGKEERGLNVHADSSVCYLDQLFMPESMRNEVLKDFHHSRLAVHPGGTKMYHDLSHQFW